MFFKKVGKHKYKFVFALFSKRNNGEINKKLGAYPPCSLAEVKPNTTPRKQTKMHEYKPGECLPGGGLGQVWGLGGKGRC